MFSNEQHVDAINSLDLGANDIGLSLMNRVFLMLLLLFVYRTRAQELYPLGEPASTIAKNVLSVKAFGMAYKEVDIVRSLSGIRLMYGATSRLSVYATATFSDFHGRSLPFDFIAHHSSGPQNDSTATPRPGVRNPYGVNSAHLYAKYRFLTRDGEHRHLRLAAYAEGSYVAVPSHHTEPDLLMNNTGVGAGIITTYLNGRFAASLTAGAILPKTYEGITYDNYGGEYPTTIKYGRAITYNLSFGYRLLPRSYKSYEQVNLNLYCEFFGRYYGAASVTEQYGTFAGALVYQLPITTPILQSGAYLDVNPGLQCIINSIYRIDASVALPMINRSYGHKYPMYMVGVQRYFSFGKHAGAKKH